jgi:hypothetical protein
VTNQFEGATALDGGAGFAAGQSGTLWLATNASPPSVPMPGVSLSAIAQPQGGGMVLQWSGVGGASCQVESSTDLVNWRPFGAVMTSSNGPNTLILPVGADPGTFFRLVPTQ